MASTSITLSALSISPSTSQPHRNPSASSPSLPCHLSPYNLSTTFMGKRLSIRIPNLNNLASKHRTAVATVLFSLPTAKPDRNSTGKSPKWSARAIKSFAMGELEARKLKYPNTGTEALLMGILVEGTSLAAKFLRANGITLFKVRDETVNLLGKSDLYFFSPEHPPLTEPAQRALDWAVDQKLKSGENGEITVTHLLLGIWSEKESAGHKILASLGFDDEKAKELSKSIMLALNKEAKKLHTVKPLPIQPPKDIAWWSFSSGSYSAYGVFQDSLTMLLRYKFDILEFKNSIQH